MKHTRLVSSISTRYEILKQSLQQRTVSINSSLLILSWLTCTLFQFLVVGTQFYRDFVSVVLDIDQFDTRLVVGTQFYRDSVSVVLDIDQFDTRLVGT